MNLWIVPLCALATGLAAWLMGGPLRRAPDDPAVPERLLQHNARPTAR